jgi:predicted amidophosphoribosyltransferase
MSATLASSDVLQALCCECGAVRTVSRRYRRFTLRCEACGRQTKHAAIGFDDRGYWEEENRRAKLKLSVDDKLDLLSVPRCGR